MSEPYWEPLAAAPPASFTLPARLGSYSAMITDWNSAVENGWYMANAAANSPPALTGWVIGRVIVHNAAWMTQEAWDFTQAVNSQRYERRQLNGVWQAWASQGGGGANQVVGHTNQLVAGTGARGTVRVGVANGQYENIGLIYDHITGAWETESVYYSDQYGEMGGIVGWVRAGIGRRFPWNPFYNCGLKPQARAMTVAVDTSSNQNGAELRILASADAVLRGSGISTFTGQYQVGYDGKYGMNYGGNASLDTGWCDIQSVVGPHNCLVVQPEVATNDTNGHTAHFYGTQLMLRWVKI